MRKLVTRKWRTRWRELFYDDFESIPSFDIFKFSWFGCLSHFVLVFRWRCYFTTQDSPVYYCLKPWSMENRCRLRTWWQRARNARTLVNKKIIGFPIRLFLVTIFPLKKGLTSVHLLRDHNLTSPSSPKIILSPRPIIPSPHLDFLIHIFIPSPHLDFLIHVFILSLHLDFDFWVL